jgi:ribosomal RNA-processing protein 8
MEKRKRKRDKVGFEVIKLTTLEKKKEKNLSKNPEEFKKNLLRKLKGGRFRYLNEQLYTTSGEEAEDFFKKDPNSYDVYHEGFRAQMEKWPINPLDLIINELKKRKGLVIAGIFIHCYF